MESDAIEKILESVAAGKTTPAEALLSLKKEPFTDLGYAKVDHHRALRQNAAEVIYGEGKTPDQIRGIAESLQQGGAKTVLVTRMKPEAVSLMTNHFADEFTYFDIPRVGLLGHMPEPTGNGTIVVAAAGTSDMYAAEEAALTAEALGNQVQRLYDVGVAGLHRLLAHMDDIMQAQVIITVAGMEGALASVVGGMASCPVIAVPTSVGYGASFGGLAERASLISTMASVLVSRPISSIIFRAQCPHSSKERIWCFPSTSPKTPHVARSSTPSSTQWTKRSTSVSTR